MSREAELQAVKEAFHKALTYPTTVKTTSPRAAASLRFSAYRLRQIMAREVPEVARVQLTLEGNLLRFTYRPSRLEQLT